ncbi:MAG: alternative ribosome rescue aminoacyl-tRNA hydrolase ArfB, partial [Nitrospinae bacterium]|nr:alternative ribosome rescue aminoacyl-tRNA hydrolase ArfB [Nitrospinota bacterium]
MLIVNERLRIPLREIHFQFARSSGPGGQNVNKVSSKAVLRWNMAASPSAPEDVKARLRALHPRRVTREGHVVIASSRFRDQGRNVADCLEKLRAALAAAADPPRP